MTNEQGGPATQERGRARRLFELLVRSVRRWAGATRSLVGRSVESMRRYRLVTPTLVLAMLGIVGYTTLGRTAWLAPRTLGWAAVAWIALAVIVILPRVQAAPDIGDERQRFEVENSARQTLLQVAGGTLLIAGAWIAWQQSQDQRAANELAARAASETLRLTREAQKTEHFTRALEQLNSDRVQLRLGAIYALERIARDSAADQWAIMEVLAAFVRERAPWTSASKHQPSLVQGLRMPDPMDPYEPRPAQDVQAALSVLGRNSWRPGFEEGYGERGYWRSWMDLSGTDLQGADLVGFQSDRRVPSKPLQPVVRVNFKNAHLDRALMTDAHFEAAQFFGAHLPYASMKGASLASANFLNADLTGAYMQSALLPNVWVEDATATDASFEMAYARGAVFDGVNLTGANFGAASLQEARFAGCRLNGVNFSEAQLTGATLRGVDVTGAAFGGTDLRGAVLHGQRGGARGLTAEQLRSAIVDHTTVLPDALKPAPPQAPGSGAPP